MNVGNLVGYSLCSGSNLCTLLVVAFSWTVYTSIKNCQRIAKELHTIVHAVHTLLTRAHAEVF